jgi:PAS domain S-box-containing protein
MLFEASPLPIIVHDGDGFVRSWNRAAETLFGFTADEARALPLPILGGEARNDLMVRVRAGQHGRLGHAVMRRKDGRDVHGALTFADVRDAAGKVSGGVVIVEPTFDEPASGGAPPDGHRVEAAQRTLGGIVHDLKNMLSAVRGFATVIAEDLPHDHVARGDIEQILKAVDRGAQLAQRLLALRGEWQSAVAATGASPSPPAASARSAGRGRAVPARAETVLVVEDDELVRLMTVKVLRRRGFSVLEASTVAQAEEHARGHAGRIDLVLTDVGLPELSGVELARRLRAGSESMKILYMTGLGRAVMAAHGVTSDTALLEKPFSPALLLERVDAMLAPNRPDSS